MRAQRLFRVRTALPVVAVCAVLVLVLAVWTVDEAPALDAVVNRFFVWIRTRWSFRAAGWAARLGGTEVVIPVGLSIAGWISYRRRSVVPLVATAAALALAAAPATLLKSLLERPEPGDALAELGRSYPSGHATSAATICLVLTALTLGGPPWPEPSPRWRRVILAVAAVVPLTVGVTMLVRSAHWLTDVVAGYLIAIAAVTAVMTAVVQWERRRAGRSVTAAGHPTTERPPVQGGPTP